MAFIRGQVRHRLSLREILAELDYPADADRPLQGYQVKVGSEREPYWLLPAGAAYTVVDHRPAEPPFATEYEASRAQEWFATTYPGFASLLETVHRRNVAPALVSV